MHAFRLMCLLSGMILLNTGCDLIANKKVETSPAKTEAENAPTERQKDIIRYYYLHIIEQEINLAGRWNSTDTPAEKAPWVESHATYCRGLLSDAKDCPDDFRAAMLEYIKAQEHLASVLKSMPSNGVQFLFTGLSNFADGGETAKDLRSQQQKAASRTAEAGNRIEQVLVKYRVPVDRVRYPVVKDLELKGIACKAGVWFGHYYISYNGVDMGNSRQGEKRAQNAITAAKTAGLKTVTICFLTPEGMLRKEVPGGEMLGITLTGFID